MCRGGRTAERLLPELPHGRGTLLRSQHVPAQGEAVGFMAMAGLPSSDRQEQPGFAANKREFSPGPGAGTHVLLDPGTQKALRSQS